MCGAVHYEVSAEPIGVGNCHCRACQKATGAAYFTEAVFPASSIAIHGALAEYASSADSGATTYRGFCPKCGSTVLGYGGSSGTMAISVSTLNEPKTFEPQMDIYVASAQPWVAMNPDTPKYAGRPKSEDEKA
ncbi:MAG: GFA family protein [Pseudomonadales bacterium]